jgi:UDP-2,4-diacetamido-2,4,6-trideoxy-beta-L-altropyranose hydrolase
MKVAFRVDASASIGTGHLVRSLALAGELRRLGADCVFLARRSELTTLEQRVAEGGHELITLVSREDDGWEADVESSRTALAGGPNVDWLVVDHYALDARWECAMRTSAQHVLALDDLADRKHDCDVLVDQNLIVGMHTRYLALVPTGCDIRVGPRYAMLKPTFAVRRASARSRDGTVRRVLVCFGGFDAQGHAALALEALRPHAATLERIDVALDSTCPHMDKVSAAAAKLPNVVIHNQADMAELLSAADLAIGAGGTMNWERACLGVPTLAFGIAANQQPPLAALIEGGYVVGSSRPSKLDASAVGAWLSCLLNNRELTRGLSLRSATLVDGVGARRVAQLLISAPLNLRRASLQDGDNLFRWRNQPEVISASFSNREIDRSTHEAWMAKTLGDPQRVLLIAEQRAEPVGVVRFDLSPPEAVISVYRVSGANSGGSLVKEATRWLQAHYPGIRKIKAEIQTGNDTSLAAFHSAGYRDAKNTLVIELDSR